MSVFGPHSTFFKAFIRHVVVPLLRFDDTYWIDSNFSKRNLNLNFLLLGCFQTKLLEISVLTTVYLNFHNTINKKINISLCRWNRDLIFDTLSLFDSFRLQTSVQQNRSRNIWNCSKIQHQVFMFHKICSWHIFVKQKNEVLCGF